MILFLDEYRHDNNNDFSALVLRGATVSPVATVGKKTLFTAPVFKYDPSLRGVDGKMTVLDTGFSVFNYFGGLVSSWAGPKQYVRKSM